MESSAKLRYLRITARKMGLLADEVRGKGINEALNYLRLSPRKRAAQSLAGVLKSAVANADQRGLVDVDTLMVKKVDVARGPIYKRWMARAKGSASPIYKRTCHVFVTLAEK